MQIKPGIKGIGRWPEAGPELRRRKALRPITPAEHLPVIHGKSTHTLWRFIVSNDYINIALVDIPVGVDSEIETHDGDEALAVLEGELILRIPAADEDSRDTAYEHHTVPAGDRFFIPAGVAHQYENFGEKPLRLYVVIAPRL